MITFHGLDNTTIVSDNQTAYEQFRYELIQKTEGVRRAVYPDSKGLPTIGIGFNLTDKNIRELVLAKFGITDVSMREEIAEIIKNNQSDIDALQTELDNKMEGLASQNPPLANRSTFTFSDGDLGIDEMRSVFDVAVTIYDEGDPTAETTSDQIGRVNDWLSGIPDSKERVVLVSLSYNGILSESTSLRRAIINDDRAEAWYEIRYNSNKDSLDDNPPDDAPGVAKRRFYESEVFGLYDDPDDISLVEAQSVYRMLQLHRDKILEYEALYGVNPDGTSGSRNMIAEANFDYDLEGGEFQVDSLTQALNPAYYTILYELNSSNGLGLGVSDYLSTDIYIDPGRSSSKETVDPDHRGFLTGSERNDILLGEGGSDILHGAAGDDVLLGGAGTDFLSGGAGNDVYVYAPGDGEDTIIDSEISGSGTNHIIVGTFDLSESQAEYTYGVQGQTIHVFTDTENGLTFEWNTLTKTVLIMGSALDDSATTGSVNSITINDISKLDDLEERFGIKLPFTLEGVLTLDNTNPFSVADHAIDNVSTELSEWGAQSFNVALNQSLTGGEQLVIQVSGDVDPDLLRLVTGDQILEFINGQIVLDVVAGQNLVAFSLLQQGGLSADVSATFTAKIISVDSEGNEIETPLSNSLILNIQDDGFDTTAGTLPTTTRDILGDFSPVDADPDEEGIQYSYDDLGNVVTDPGSPEDREDTLYDSEGNDFISSGAGNDAIFLGHGGDDVVGTGDGDDTVQKTADGNVNIALGDGDDWFRVYNNGAGRVVAEGGEGRDYLGGSVDGDVMIGGAGADCLHGAGGNDLLYGDAQGDAADFILNGATEAASGVQGELADAEDGNDQIFTGAGDDFITAGDGDDLVVSGGGDDYIRGDLNIYSPAGADWKDWAVTETITTDENGTTYSYEYSNLSIESSSGTGNDTIFAGAGNDVVSGEGGDDTILLEDGDDKAWGGAGRDTILGGEGADIINGDNGFSQLDEALHGDDFLDGGNGNDTLYGMGGDDTLYGGMGDDMLSGDSSSQTEGGNDYLNGEAGSDILYGGLGNDTLLGGSGSDELQGGADDDVLYGGSEDDLLFGDEGDNTGNGHDLLYGGEGNDQLQGAGGNDSLFGDEDDDILFGQEGEDYLSGGSGSDQLLGGTENDILHGDDGDDYLWGEDGDDILYGGNDNDYLFGDLPDQTGTGNDVLYGESGDDILQGAGGDDDLYGGEGEDLLVGQDGDDLLSGGAGDDELQGGEGHDALFGDEDNDLLFGEAGNDDLDGGAGDDQLQGEEGDDYLNGGVGNDVLLGQDGNDSLYGDDGNDYLNGGEGNDILYGGEGNDVLVAGNGEDYLNGGIGDDTYHFSLGSGIKHLTDVSGYNSLVLDGIAISGIKLSLGSLLISTGVAGDELHLDGVDYDDLVNTSPINSIEFSDGMTMSVAEVIETVGIDYATTEDADVITGTSARDNIDALAGDDVINTGAGNDIIDLGAGDDYAAAGEGDDTVMAGDGADVVAGDAGDDHINGGSGTDSLDGGDGADVIDGGADNDILYGRQDDDQLFGGLGDDQLDGGAGNDLLDGGEGADLMVGGSGDDSYYVENGGDSLQEDTDAGTDSVVSTLDYVLGANLENLQLVEGSEAVHATGNNLSNILNGNSANNTIFGLAGDDTLVGGAGNDYLDGGEGVDIMLGGSGDDLYMVDDAADSISEAAGEGTDQVTASVDYTLSEHLESLVLSGENAMHGTGNSGDNAIYGNALDNRLDGGASDDELYGEGGADTLIGGTGSDNLFGGDGDDTYHVDNIADTVVENADQGVDTVESVIDYTLGENVENLTLSGVGNISGTGNAGANILTGNAGQNALSGEAGNDVLFGGDGADILSGGSGVDTLYGGAGDDTYVIDGIEDTLIEVAEEGRDTVESSVDYTLTENFENLLLTGNAETAVGNDLDNSLVGNDLDNVLDGAVGADTMAGGSGDDIYLTDQSGDQIIEYGLAGNDTEIRSYESTESLADHVENLVLADGASTGTGNDLDNALTGNAEDNTLSGLSGNDVLDGGDGSDILQGGDGDDTYVIDDGDTVIEYADEGTDTVRTSSDIILGDFLENVVLTGDGAINATGNALDNQLVGNENDNVLNGGAGGDSLIGGAGDDTYYTDSDGDYIFEEAAGGIDTEIRSHETLNLLNTNVENLVLTGNVYRGNGNELDNIIEGNAVANNLWGREGDDILYGYDGDDQLIGAEGHDVLDGGAGNDLMTGDSGDDILYGGEGNDQLDGGGGTNILRGGSGDDVYVYGAETGLTTIDNSDGGTDWLIFTDGMTRDRLSFVRSEDDLIVRVDNNEGTQVVIENWFLEGDYQLAYIQPAGAGGISAWTINRMFEPENPEPDGIETPDSSLFEMLWYGTEVGEQLVGDDVDELIRAYQGDDSLFGMAGDDWLLGGSGADYLDGGAGSDTLFGGSGNDQLGGGAGDDTLIGGADSDIYVYGAEDGADTIDNSGGGTDWLIFTDGITGDRLIYLQDGNDLIIRVDGDETTQVTVTDWFVGSDYQIDYIQPDGGYGIPAAEIANLLTTGGSFDTVVDGTSAGEQLVGTSGADQLNGFAGDDQLFGLGGNDELNGGDGADYLDGGAGDDLQSADAGDDQLGGDAGNDTLIGGTGNDIYVYRAGSGADTIDNSGGGTDWLIFTDDITGDRLGYLQSGDDLIVRIDGDETTQVTISNWFVDGEYQLAYIQPSGESGIAASTINALFESPGDGSIEIPPESDFATVVTGTENAEQLVGTNGSDLLKGLAGDDQLFGLSGNDWLVAGDNNDYLDGGAGDDVQLGEAGDDQLGGDAGNDTLIGGTGNDIYVCRPGSGADTIDNSDGGTDWLIFTDDITGDRLGYLQSGDDLIVRIDGDETSQVTVGNWFAGSEYQLAYIQPSGGYGIPADQINSLVQPEQAAASSLPLSVASAAVPDYGSALTDADINQIIQEMSAFSTAEGISLDSLDDVRQHEELMTMIAESWQAA